jgi:hypothetical protein
MHGQNAWAFTWAGTESRTILKRHYYISTKKMTDGARYLLKTIS